jgi:hypothetical protein
MILNMDNKFRPKGDCCECGHYNIFHLSYQLKGDTAPVTRCFGSDETAYWNIVSTYDLNSDEVSQPIIAEQVICPCKHFIPGM